MGIWGTVGWLTRPNGRLLFLIKVFQRSVSIPILKICTQLVMDERSERFQLHCFCSTGEFDNELEGVHAEIFSKQGIIRETRHFF